MTIHNTTYMIQWLHAIDNMVSYIAFIIISSILIVTDLKIKSSQWGHMSAIASQITQRVGDPVTSLSIWWCR